MCIYLFIYIYVWTYNYIYCKSLIELVFPLKGLLGREMSPPLHTKPSGCGTSHLDLSHVQDELVLAHKLVQMSIPSSRHEHRLCSPGSAWESLVLPLLLASRSRVGTTKSNQIDVQTPHPKPLDTRLCAQSFQRLCVVRLSRCPTAPVLHRYLRMVMAVMLLEGDWNILKLDIKWQSQVAWLRANLLVGRWLSWQVNMGSIFGEFPSFWGMIAPTYSI